MDDRILSKIKRIASDLNISTDDILNFLNIGCMALFKESIYKRASTLSKYEDSVVDKELLGLLGLGIVKSLSEMPGLSDEDLPDIDIEEPE